MTAVAFILITFGFLLVFAGIRGVSLPHELLKVFGGAQ